VPLRITDQQFALFEAARAAPPKAKRPRPFRLTAGQAQLSENDVEAQIVGFLKIHGWRVDRQHVGRAKWPAGGWLQLHPEGTADWFAHRPRTSPSCLYVEVKAPGQRASREQELYLEMARLGGYLAGCFDSFPAFHAFYQRHFPGEA